MSNVVFAIKKKKSYTSYSGKSTNVCNASYRNKENSRGEEKITKTNGFLMLMMFDLIFATLTVQSSLYTYIFKVTNKNSGVDIETEAK